MKLRFYSTFCFISLFSLLFFTSSLYCLYKDQFASTIGYPREDISLISPYSMRDMSALLYLGAEGETKEQLQPILNSLCENRTECTVDLLKEEARKYKEYLTTSIALFIDSRITIFPLFLENIEHYWKSSSIMNLSFQKEAVAAIAQANSSIARMTNNRLKNLLSVEDIDSETVALLVATLAFDANWQYQFDPAFTKKSLFFKTTERGEESQVCDMMKQSSSLEYFTDSDWNYVALPFQKKGFQDSTPEFICEIILPPKNFEVLSQDKKRKKYLQFSAVARKEAKKEYITLFFPKLTLRKRADLKKMYQEMGATSLFDQQRADFSKMSPFPLVVQKLFQEVQLTIDEFGAKVEAATVAGIGLKSMLPLDSDRVVECNRPFFLLIREKNGATPILFAHISSANSNNFNESFSKNASDL